MRTFLQKLLKTKFTRGMLMLTVLASIAACIAMASGPDTQIKLGGTWVGRLGDVTWTGSYAPDASGQNAVITLQWMTLNTDFQWLTGNVGATTMSLASGSMTVTSPDTARGKLIWYALDPGVASATAPVAGQVKAILVMTSKWHFTSPTTAVGTHNIKIYLPSSQGSMLPEDGTLFFDQTFEDTPHQKIL